MQTLILNGESAGDIKLIAEIAKKMGLKAKILSEEEKEDVGMLNAIKKKEELKNILTLKVSFRN